MATTLRKSHLDCQGENNDRKLLEEAQAVSKRTMKRLRYRTKDTPLRFSRMAIGAQLGGARLPGGDLAVTQRRYNEAQGRLQSPMATHVHATVRHPNPKKMGTSASAKPTHATRGNIGA